MMIYLLLLNILFGQKADPPAFKFDYNYGTQNYTQQILNPSLFASKKKFRMGFQWGGDHRLFNIVILSILPVILSAAKNPVEISRSLSGAEMNIVFFWNLIFNWFLRCAQNDKFFFNFNNFLTTL